nr:MAG TPA_asm: hypothetical protein [Bacteriophage sp.]
MSAINSTRSLNPSLVLNLDKGTCSLPNCAHPSL